MVKLFTIVKDEVDIVKDWIIYHGSMFGWQNIHIIDNFSTDGTYEVIQEFKELINIYREPDYKKKGDYMTNLINKHSYGNDRLAFPIDIDEFIVYYDKDSNSKEISVDKNLITNYIHNLPMCRVYKANYLNPQLNVRNSNRVTVELAYSTYNDMGVHAKSFVDTRYFTGSLDHGNHLICNDSHLTKIALVHYHFRNIEQMKKKIYNNVVGLGYDVNSLHQILASNPHTPGNHHIKNLIELNESRFQIPYVFDIEPNNAISIVPLKNRINDGFF
jgi:hypothetical protein